MNALGLIETVGLPAAIAAADAAVKSANVQLHDYELTKGKGLITVKFEGDVGAVSAALDAADIVAQSVGEVYSKLIIARPDDQLEKIIKNEETIEPAIEPAAEAPTETAAFIEEMDQSTVSEDTPSEVLLIETANEEDSGEEGSSSVVNLEKDICNLCHDPECPRKKGDLKALCIHYENEEE